jgi:hypothetical protein
MTGQGTLAANPGVVRTCRVSVSIAEVAAGRAAAIAAAFGPGEHAWAAGASSRTLVGRIAAKRALDHLAGRAGDRLDAWVIVANPDGAPRVAAAPCGDPADWHVAISHDRTTAWALAAIQATEARP